MLPVSEQYAVFIDIDGTLMKQNHEIPERNIRAILKAKEQGHKFFINTGRSLSNIPKSIIKESGVDGVVCGDGTLVVYDGKMFEGEMVSDSVIRKVAEYVYERPDVFCEFEGINKCYSFDGPRARYFPGDINVGGVDELFDAIKGDKIQVMFISSNIDSSFKNEMSQYISFYDFGEFYDMVTVGSNKVQGIERVLEITGISREHTIAIGDSENDKGMLEFCRIGACMGDGQQILKNVADYITVPHNEGGVGEAIEKYLISLDPELILKLQ